MTEPSGENSSPPNQNKNEPLSPRARRVAVVIVTKPDDTRIARVAYKKNGIVRTAKIPLSDNVKHSK